MIGMATYWNSSTAIPEQRIRKANNFAARYNRMPWSLPQYMLDLIDAEQQVQEDEAFCKQKIIMFISNLIM